MKGNGRKIAIVSLVIGVIVAATIGLANFSKLTSKTLISNVNPQDEFLMEYNELTNSDANFTETPNVTFTAFFPRDEKENDGIAEKYNGTCNQMNSKATLFMDLNVMNEGYLKDGATITIQGSNFDFSMFMIKDSILKDNYIGTDITEIKFNKVEPGSEKMIFGSIISNIGNNTNNYSNTSKIIFDGIYVNSNDEEIPLHKEIELTVDWYGKVQTSLNTSGKATYYYDNMTSSQIKFSFTGNETLNQILLKDAIATATIPTLNGYDAISAEPSVSGINYEFENGVLTMTKSSTVDDNGIITNSLSKSNTFTINVTYPLEAYETINSYTELKVPVTCQYVGYNNPDEQCTAMSTSNVAEGVVTIVFTKTPEATPEQVYSHSFDVQIMNKQHVYKPSSRYVMSKQDLLNLYDNADYEGNYEYTVRWYAYSGNAAKINSFKMNETVNEGNAYGDKYDEIVLDEYTANKGIYFANADNALGENGEIRVYNNDTNELIETFTKDNWNTYSANNVYEYDESIKHIRVETSSPNESTYLYVYNVKEFDAKKITENISKEQMEQASQIYTYLTGTADVAEVGIRNVNDVDSAYLVSETSDAKISLSIPRASTQETNNETIYIDTIANQTGDAKWKNGEFIVEVPQEIINMEVNNITVDKQDVNVLAWDLCKEKDKYLIRIITSNENETTYRISIDCIITPDSRIGSGNRNFNLYAYNEKCNDYYTTAEDIYDVDNDSITNEQVGKATCSIELLSPTSLMTLETVSDYNDENEITIAPNVAAVEKDERVAKINLSLRNNYPYTIDGITILGKIPFEGNTYVLHNSKSMNSEFDSTFATAEQLNSNEVGILSSMTNVSNNMVVYYSENENPTRDLTDSSNGWVASANVQDISTMKTYLVKLNNFELRQNEEAILYYWVYLPEGLDYNSVSYSNHAVYYDFITDGGRLPLSTEPAKVGIKIVDKYDLDLTKLKVNSSLTIPNVTYSLTYTDKDTEGNNKEYSRILTTNSSGKIIVEDLLANITYTLKEVKVPDTCELSDNIVTFIIDQNGELHLTGTVKNSSFESNTTLKLQLEDEIKANLQITKTKAGTSTPINNVRFSLTDPDGNIKSVTTQNGVLTLNGLSLNKLYTLKEVSGPNNIELKTESTKFTLIRAEGGIKVNVSENGLGASLTNANASNIVAEVDGQDNEILNPTIEMRIQNEVRYSLELNKKDDSDAVVQGAQFVIKGRGFKTEGSKYTTTRYGTLSISGLYVGSEYTLEEISAPGYYLDSEANNNITFTVSRSGNLVVTSSNGSGITVVGTPTITDDNAESLNPKLNVTVENEKIPTYNLKLIKENDQGESLVGAQFKLKSLDTGKEEVLTIEQDSDNMFEGLYEFITDKPFVTGEYELTEIYAPEGYKLDMTPIKFKATRDENTGVVDFIIISGGDNIKIDGNNDKVISADENGVTITVVNKPIFNLIKKGENDVLLPNAKFTITNLEGEPVTGSDGEIVGTLENGKYIVTTDSEGKITANLSEGLYKAVEIEAPDGYELPENEEDRTYLFGIGASRGLQTNDKIDKLEWARAMGSDYISEFKDVIATQDGGVIAVGSTDTNTYVEGGNSVNGYGNQDGIIVKYDANGNIVWQKLFGGRNNDELFAIAEDTRNGGYAVVGYNFAHDANSDATGNCLKYDGTTISGLGDFGNNDGVILKINEDGSLNWCQSIGGTRVDRINAVVVNDDGDIAVTGSFYGTIYLDSTKSASLTSKGEKDAFISVYSSIGVLQWYRNLGSANGDVWGNAIATTSDKGFVVGVNFLGTLQIDKDGSTLESVASKGNADGALVAYSSTGSYKWYKQIGSSNNDSIYDVIDYNVDGVNTIVATGGYAGAISEYSLAALNGSYYDGFIIKFDESGTYKTSMNIGGNRDEVIASIVPTKDGGLLFGGWLYSTSNFTFKGQTFQAVTANSAVTGDAPNDGFIVELDNEDNLIWKDQIKGSLYESVNGVAQTLDGNCFAVGDFESQSLTVMNKTGAMKNVLSYDSDGFVIKYGKSVLEAAIQETAEVVVNNELKKYTITTEVGPNEKNNNQRIGGTITGRYTNEYIPGEFIQFVENVKHGNNSEQPIVIKPITDYAIVEITINGEKIAFTPDENGIVTLPVFENVTENKHIVVKFATQNHTIKVKKVNEAGETLESATFEVKSNNDTPTLGTLIDNGRDYIEIRDDKKIDLSTETGIFGTPIGITQNYNVEDKTKDVTSSVLGAISDNGNTYTFVSNGNGGYVSTPDMKGKADTANSYFEIDLTGSEYTGKNYVVSVNANISSRQNYDFGYATITTSNTSAPVYSNSSGRFIYISGTTAQQTTPTDYRTNTVLQGGNKYYLYLGYRKAATTSSENDEFTVNSIKVYEAQVKSYEFIENNGVYTPNNIDSSIYYSGNSIAVTSAKTSIPIDLTGKEGKYFIAVNAQASSTISSESLYVAVNNTQGNTSTNRFVSIYNSIANTYTSPSSYLLEGGKTYYLNMEYINYSSGTTDDVKINSIDLYKTSTYDFDIIDDGEGNISYISNNVGKNGTYAYSYIPVDLTNSAGDYKITVEGTIAGTSSDYAFATVQTDIARQDYNTSANRFVYQSGANNGITTVTGNKTVVGGQLYYIHLGYYNGTSNTTLADNFTVTNVKIEPVIKTYTGTTDSNGIAVIDVEDLGKYQITETNAPEHYIKSDEVKNIELTSSSKENLYTFTDRAIPTLIVHRYYKDSNGNYTTIKVAEDEATEGMYDEEYATSPYATLEGEQINLDGLTLEKLEGEYVTPVNAVGTYSNAVTEVTYYFEANPITLTIRHLEEGTDNELAERTVVTQKIDYEFDEEFNHTISSSFDYDLDGNSDYNTLKDEYVYSTTTTQSEDENGNKGDLNYANIGDMFTYSSDSEITYYYNKKVHTITSEVESHKENRTDSAVNTKVEVDVDGGSITGSYNAEYLEANGIKFIETVKDKENALSAVVATPDENYRVQYIELVSTPEEGEAVSKVIYGTKTVVDGENTTVINAETVEGVSVTVDANGVVSVAALENITEDKHFVVRFTPDEGTVTVHYIIKGETPAENVEHSNATITDLVGEPYATGPISIADYRMIESSNNTSGDYINGNIDVYYYYELDSYEYSVEYYYDNVLDPAMTESGDEYKAKYEAVISTYPTQGKVKDGYVFDHDSKVPLIVSDDSSLNVMKVYYVKRSDLEYTVHYKEQDTEETLTADKTVGNQTFADTVTENAIDISGYVKVAPTSADIEITTGVNEHTFYYTKRTDLSYTVNYLEKDTDEVIHTPKVTGNQTFKSVITSANEVIDIDGYNYDSVDKNSLTIEVDETSNVINIYYTKRTDLEYTVHYKEQGTNATLATDKEVDGQTFGDIVTENAIDISGYVKVAPTSADIEITTGTNEHTFYYTKRNDLSYTVNYLEKDTDEVLHTAKTTGNQTFKSVITSANEVIDIDGYNYDSVDKNSLTIEVDETSNVINIYYTKRNDLEYTVHYKEQGTDETLATDKEVNGQTFGDTVTENAIDINGYVKVAPTSADIEITTGTNEHTFYYTKRTDLEYTVHYKEQGTETTLAADKTVRNQTFGDTVTENAINIPGYVKVEPTSADIEITTDANEHTFYYTKRNDLSYTVNYLEKDTNTVIHAPKRTGNQTYKSVITSVNEVIDIDGYNYDSVDKETSTIEVDETSNVINIYYVKRSDLSYIVHYREEGVEGETGKLADDKEVDGQTFGDTVTENAINIPGYVKVEPTSADIEITTGVNEHTFYYRKQTGLAYTVNYLEKGTNTELYESKTVDGKTFRDQITSADEIIDISGYEYDSLAPAILTISADSEDNVINIYYKKAKFDYTVHYFYDGEEDASKTVTKQAEYLSEISTFTDKGEGYVFIEAKAYDSEGRLQDAPLSENPLVIGADSSKNVINVYYRSAYEITTSVKSHTEKYSDGTTRTVKGGTISGENAPEGYYETVLKGDDSTKSIVIKPDSGYEITKVTITESIIPEGSTVAQTVTRELDIDSFKDANGKITLNSENGYFNTVTSNKHVEAEFKKKTKVTVKYLEKGTLEVLADEVEIPGLEGDVFNPEVVNITNYRTAKVKVSDTEKASMTYVNVIEEDGEEVEVYTKFDPSAENTMFADEVTVICWYEKIPEGTILVKHIEVDENDIKDGLTISSGVVLKEESYTGQVGTSKEVTRKEFTDELTGRKYISVDGPEGGEPVAVTGRLALVAATGNTRGVTSPVSKLDGVIIIGKDKDDYTVEYVEVDEDNDGRIDSIEVRFYYEKQYNVTTEVKEHTELVNDVATDVKGGTISGDAQESYEMINNKGANVKSIIAEPDENYRVKIITVNGREINISEFEDASHKVTIPAGYFEQVSEDKHVAVEFEKIPAKVIVKYLDIDTNEEIKLSDIELGGVGDDYSFERADIYGYEKAGEDPSNAEGVMTEDDITVVFYYKKYTTKLVIKYVDIDTNKEIKDSDSLEGYFGDDYETVRAEIKGYEATGDEPANASGVLDKAEVIVTYYYKKVEEKTVEPGDEPGDEPEVEPVDKPEDKPEQKPRKDQKDEEKTIENIDKKQITNETKQEQSNVKSPQTGDNIVKVMILLVLSSFGLVTIHVKFGRVEGKHWK